MNNATVSFTDLDQSKMIIFEYVMTIFKASIIFRGSWGTSKNWLEHKVKPLKTNLACLNKRNTLYLALVSRVHGA
jgi:hypothetical protein